MSSVLRNTPMANKSKWGMKMDEKLKGYQSTLMFLYKSNAICSPKFVKKLPFTVCCYTA